MAIKTITGNELQEKLLNEFFDSRYFPSQHDFAARAEIVALQERIAELEGKPAKKGREADKPVS